MAQASRKLVRQPVRLPQSRPSLRRPPCVSTPSSLPQSLAKLRAPLAFILLAQAALNTHTFLYPVVEERPDVQRVRAGFLKRFL